MSNTILVPVDFSEASRAAIQRAQSIARSEGGRLRLLHAHPAPGEDLGARLTERLREALRHDAKLRLAAFAATCDDGSTPLSTVFEEADPAHAIRAAAEDDAVGLVVMGSHGRRGVDRWVLGSVAARVVQRAPKPVLVVRHELPADRDQGPPMRSILLATDFSERAAAVEAEVIAWAKRFGAEVEVLHVIRETSVMLAPYAVTGSSDFEGEMFEAAASRMQGVLRRLAERGVHAKSKIVYGLPSEEILRRAEATNVDLVAMGTRGYSGLQRFFLGSVAQRVLSQARCDVLVAAGNDALAESHETEARFVAAAADPIAHTTARVEAVVAAVDAEPLETREPVRSAAAPTAPAVPAVTASVPLATAITTPAAPAETTPYADPDDDWVPPRAEDLTDRLFALVMAGVLGVILAFSIAAAGI